MDDKEIKDLTEQTVLDDTDKFLLQDGLTDEAKYAQLVTLKARMNEDAEYQLLDRTALVAVADAITISGLSTYKYLKVVAFMIPSGAIDTFLRLNNDSGANYAYRFDGNNGTTSTSVSTTSLAVNPTGGAVCKMIELTILNVTNQEKLVSGVSTEPGTAGAANLPSRAEFTGKWANTANPVSRIDLINAGAGDFAAGSELLVYGHN